MRPIAAMTQLRDRTGLGTLNWRQHGPWPVIVLLAIVGWCSLVAVPLQAADGKSPKSVTVIVKDGETAERVGKLVEDLQRRGQQVVILLSDSTSPDSQRADNKQQSLSLLDLPEHFRQGLAYSIARVWLLPVVMADARAWWSTASSWPAFSTDVSRLAAVVAISVVMAMLVQWIGCRLLPPAPQTGDATFLHRLRFTAARFAIDVVAIAALLLVGEAISKSVLPLWSMDAAGTAILRGLAGFGLYWAFARFLIGPVGTAEPLLPIPNPRRNARLFLIYAFMLTLNYWLAQGALTVVSTQEPVLGLIYLSDSVRAVYKVWWLFVVRNDVAEAVLRSAVGESQPGVLTRTMATMIPAVSIATPIALWILLTATATSPDGAVISAASAVTQALCFVVPILAGGAAVVTWHLCSSLDASVRVTPLLAAARAGLSALAAGAVVVGGLLALSMAWDFAFRSSSPKLAAAMEKATLAGGVLMCGWIVLSYIKALFDAHAPARAAAMPGQDEDKESTPQSRRLCSAPM